MSTYTQKSYLPPKLSAYRRRKAKEKLKQEMERFATRNYVIFPRSRSIEIPIIEVFEGETVEVMLQEMKTHHRHYEYRMIEGGYVESTEPRQVRPTEAYTKRNLQWVRRRIVQIGFKPQDERPPCRLFQLKVDLKRGRQPKTQ